MTPEVALRMARRRMHTQHLAGARLARPEDVVGWFGASQAQEYGPAKWALGQRTDAVSETDVEKGLADGTILRTHVLRPTWHFVLPTDIKWMLDLTGPRVLVQTASYYRRVGLDEATLEKSNKTIERALRGGNHLTRKELKAALERSGIDVEGFRPSFIMMNAELRGLVCSGARSGRQHAYALLEERAPSTRRLDPDESLAELTLRYFRSHGPATIKDLAWWSSLKVADIKRGLEMVRPQLVEEEIDGVSYWCSPPPSGPEPDFPNICLLQPFDEYAVAYRDSRGIIDASGLARAHHDGDLLGDAVVLDSQVVGTWKHTIKRDELLIEVELYAPLDDARTRALNASASRYAGFMGLPAVVETSVITSKTGTRR
ncbi:winged helix DNA-binding domain-containing protein [soil metagenome]